jgi:hypothetical protein
MRITDLAASLYGLTSDQARTKVEAENVVCRIGSVEGQPLIVTRDYRTDRISIDILNDRVVGAKVG